MQVTVSYTTPEPPPIDGITITLNREEALYLMAVAGSHYCGTVGQIPFSKMLDGLYTQLSNAFYGTDHFAPKQPDYKEVRQHIKTPLVLG